VTEKESFTTLAAGARLARAPGTERRGQHHGDREDDPSLPDLPGDISPPAGADGTHADHSPPTAAAAALADPASRPTLSGCPRSSREWPGISGSTVNLFNACSACQQYHPVCASWCQCHKPFFSSSLPPIELRLDTYQCNKITTCSRQTGLFSVVLKI